MPRITQRLNGLNPLSYIGFDAQQPTDIKLNNRDPLTSDRRNVYLGTWWLNTTTQELFYLAALANGEATWISVSSSVGGIMTLTADSGGAVSPDVNGNIHVIGDVTTVLITGDVLTNTLTISAQDATVLTSLTGNSGGPVEPTAGNINVVGTGIISIAGNPGTSTLTISQATSAATSFPTQSGTAVPSLGVLNIIGSGGLSTTGSGNTVTAVGGSSLATSFITSPATGTAIPAAGVLTFASGTNETISAVGSTVTFTGAGSGGGIPSYSTGSFMPAFQYNAGVGSVIYGTQVGFYTQIGDVVFIKITLQGVRTGTLSGLMSISGLPFTVSNTYGDNLITYFVSPIGGSGNSWYSPIPTPTIFFGVFISTTTTIDMYYSSGNAAVTRLPSTSASNEGLYITGWYYK